MKAVAKIKKDAPPQILNMRYTCAQETDVSELFDRVNPKWRDRPPHLEPRDEARNRINNWTR